MATAGIVVIGNEVLSGKVEEENARFMIRELRRLGVSLQRIVVIRDQVDAIARDVREMSEAYDHVFTSGGVGSTHDDVTMEGVARALGVPIVRHARLVELLEARYGPRTNAAVLRMADVPEGAVLLGAGELRYPVLQVRNVYVLPGVPQFLRVKFEWLAARIAPEPVHVREIYLRVGEDEIADLLREAQGALPEVEIGSYPRFDIEEYRVRVTVEAREAAAVERAIAALLGRLDPEHVIRVE